jgi:hypothetical protein
VAFDSRNSPDGLLLILSIDGDRVKGSAMGEVMAHSGTHIADLRESPMGRNLFQLEGRAWGVTVMSAINNKEKTLTLQAGMWRGIATGRTRTNRSSFPEH